MIAQPTNYQIKTFEESKKVEEVACGFIIPYFKKLYGDGFEDVRDNENYWQLDIDFFINGNSLELKANSKIIKNFLFELKQECSGNKKDGNLLTSQAEYWLITDNEKKVGWLFKLKELKIKVLQIIKNKELEGDKWNLYHMKDSGKDRASRSVSINRDYLLSKMEFCKRIDFGNNF